MKYFFRSLKNKWGPVTGCVNLSDATHAMTGQVDGYYSALRPHDCNSGLPPNESENRYRKNAIAVASFVDHYRLHLDKAIVPLRQGRYINSLQRAFDLFEILHVPHLNYPSTLL